MIGWILRCVAAPVRSTFCSVGHAVVCRLRPGRRRRIPRRCPCGLRRISEADRTVCAAAVNVTEPLTSMLPSPLPTMPSAPLPATPGRLPPSIFCGAGLWRPRQPLHHDMFFYARTAEMSRSRNMQRGTGDPMPSLGYCGPAISGSANRLGPASRICGRRGRKPVPACAPPRRWCGRRSVWCSRWPRRSVGSYEAGPARSASRCRLHPADSTALAVRGSLWYAAKRASDPPTQYHTWCHLEPQPTTVPGTFTVRPFFVASVGACRISRHPTACRRVHDGLSFPVEPADVAQQEYAESVVQVVPFCESHRYCGEQFSSGIACAAASAPMPSNMPLPRGGRAIPACQVRSRRRRGWPSVWCSRWRSPCRRPYVSWTSSSASRWARIRSTYFALDVRIVVVCCQGHHARLQLPPSSHVGQPSHGSRDCRLVGVASVGIPMVAVRLWCHRIRAVEANSLCQDCIPLRWSSAVHLPHKVCSSPYSCSLVGPRA